MKEVKSTGWEMHRRGEECHRGSQEVGGLQDTGEGDTHNKEEDEKRKGKHEEEKKIS